MANKTYSVRLNENDIIFLKYLQKVNRDTYFLNGSPWEMTRSEVIQRLITEQIIRMAAEEEIAPWQMMQKARSAICDNE